MYVASQCKVLQLGCSDLLTRKHRFRMSVLDILVNSDLVVFVYVFKLYNDQAQRHVAD